MTIDNENINGNPPSIESNFISSGGYGNQPLMDDSSSLINSPLTLPYVRPIADEFILYDAYGNQPSMEDGWIWSDTSVNVTPTEYNWSWGDTGSGIECLAALADERGTFAELYDVNQPPPLPNDNENKLIPMWSFSKQGANLKRKRQQEAIGNRTKRGHRIVDIGESSAYQQPEPEVEPKPKREEESLKKSVGHATKVIKDRISRRAKKDKIEDMASYIWLRGYENPNKDGQLYPSLNDALAQFQQRWPMRPDLQKLLKDTTEIEKDCKFTSKGMDERLDEVLMNLAKADEERQKGVSVAHLRKEVHSEFPWLCPKSVADQDQGNFRTHEQMLYTFAKDNKQVNISNFQDLENAIGKTTEQSILKHLDDIDNRIKKARGKDTEYANKEIEVLVCASIYEMENLELEELNGSMLKKWEETFNMARKRGFRVEFAEILLREKLNAYFAYSEIQRKKGPEIRA